MPDFFVPLDTTRYTKFHRQLAAKGLVINASLRYIDNHRALLKSKYSSFDDCVTSYEIPQTVIDGIYDEGKKQKVEPVDDTERNNTTAALKTQLNALVARDIWDMSQYFQIMNETNDIVRKAVELIR